jgi:hypothetical protein
MNDLTLTLNGLCLAFDFRALVLTGPHAEDLAKKTKWPIAAQGEIKLELAVALFDRPFIFTPRSIITERNQTFEWPLLLDWLPDGGYQMPRSEVFGLDVRGRETQIFARDIDIEMSPIAVLGHATWVMGLVEIDPASADQPQRIDRPEWPDRFRRALKCYRAGPSADLQKLL